MSFSPLNLFTDMFNKFETFLAINKKKIKTNCGLYE